MKRLTKQTICLILVVSIICSMSVVAFATDLSLGSDGSDTYTLDEVRAIADDIGYELDSDKDGLVDVLELAYGSNPYDADTDGDGVDDYTEFCITHTDLFTADGDIDTDGDGLTNAEEAIYKTHAGDPDIDGDGLSDGDEVNLYGTDPLVADTDGDGLLDGIEIELGLNPLVSMTTGAIPDAETEVARKYLDRLENEEIQSEESYSIDVLAVGDDTDYDGRSDSIDSAPKSNLFGGKLYTAYATSNVSYNMDYRWFFSSNTNYNSKLATVSSLLASNIYADNHLNITSGGSLTTTNSNAMTSWMSFHGMKDIKNYQLTNADNHVSQMYVGHREVTYGGATKNIVCVVVRGTNGTLKEWSSNFDIGSTTTKHTEWTATSNHKGFDITTNRLNTNLNNYLSTYCSGKNNILWITGHSRGAAIGNLLAAKQIDAGKTVYAYTFAAPNTTTSTSASATKYKCIFNLVNTDDFVPYLPMSAWSFKRYGITKTASIANSYETEWEKLTGKFDYNPDTFGLQDTINALAAVSTNRNNCYVYRSGTDGYIHRELMTATDRDNIRKNIIAAYTSNMAGTYKYTNVTSSDPNFPFEVRIFHQPAFLMQSLAGVMAGEMTKTTFTTLDVAPYLENAKWKVISSTLGGIEHPHYTESYYLLATKLS